MTKFINGNEHYGVYVNNKVKGRAECDHNDLRCIIGFERWTFDTEWSRRNSNSVYLYRDPYNIDSVALTDGIEDIQQIENATHYDSSQRAVIVTVGQVALVQNIYGFWVAIKLITVKNKHSDTDPRPLHPKEKPKPWDLSHMSEPGEEEDFLWREEEKLVFDYEIQTTGSYSFGPNAKNLPYAR